MTGHPPAGGRIAYADAGLCLRYSRATLEAAQPTAFVRRVWEATAVDLLGSWSRRSDSRRYLTRDVCRLLGLDPTKRGNRSKVGAALGELADLGAIGYRPGSGAHPAIITLPEPPDDWTDPTCGRTAGELRERRNRADDDSPPPTLEPAAEAGRPSADHVTHRVGDPPAPGWWARQYEKPYEKPFPCADRRAPAAPPAAGAGKATKQQPPEPAPLDALALALPDPLRRSLAAPDQIGGRRTLARLLDDLLDAGWHLDDLVDAIAGDLPPAPSPGVLIDRARRYLDDGPPLDLDAIAAEEAAEARARQLAAAAGHGRTRAALALAAGAPPLDDVVDDAARQYPHDLEARAVFVDAYRVALAEAAGAEPAPARRPASAPVDVDVDAARARIARIRAAALAGTAA